VQPPDGLYKAVESLAWVDMEAALRLTGKQERGKALDPINTRVLAVLEEKVSIDLTPISLAQSLNRPPFLSMIQPPSKLLSRS